jgi:GNAT superfamily N-acetyltransferase
MCILAVNPLNPIRSRKPIMFSSIQIHDHRGSCQGFVCSSSREDWRIFLEALDTDEGERLSRALGTENHPRIAVLQGIVVAEAHRGQNVGRRLIEDFLRIAEADVVIVEARRPSLAFFRSLGFRNYGVTGLMTLRPAEEDALQALAA